ncbi:hypothetical protein GUJ93_ZPchr0010g8670 [Zizania palustris]|uniref:Uncharacterized protein n=1 Tax=Zizania palustris TaxID=103762 RepID=A0A8J6BM41_ZIZPA|nr:hypothetical protein GUJ93_ZPchr0010g8670 [Zizania palustris]
MDSDVEMPVTSDEEMLDDEDYYDYSDMADGDDGGGGYSDEELVAGDYEGREAEGTDEVESCREQVSLFSRWMAGGRSGGAPWSLCVRRDPRL